MNIETIQSPPSLIYPLYLQNIPKVANTYPPLYAGALNQFYIYFDQMVKDFFPKQAQETDRVAHYSKFQGRFCIDTDQITILPANQKIPEHFKQARLIRTIGDLFCLSFDPNLQPSESQVAELKSPKNSQPEKKVSDTQRQSGILSLPQELLLLIFNHSISNWRSLSRLALTCKKFYHIVENPHDLKQLFELSSSIFPSILNRDLSRHLLTFTNFHPVYFGQANLEDKDLEILASQSTELESLSLLRGRFTPQGFAHLLKCCPRLQSLEFHQFDNDNFDDYMTTVALFADHLEHLKISNCAMSDRSLLALGICAPRLRSFEYENHSCQGLISDYGLLPFFSRMSHLEVIKLTGCPKVTQASLISYIDHSINPAENLLKGTELKHLKFSYCGVIDTALFNSISQHCPDLESLELEFESLQCINQRVDKRNALIQVASACSNLRSLKLSGCTYLSSQNLRTMLNHCGNLLQLELSGSQFLKDSFFEGLSTCEALQHLKLHPSEPANISQQNLTLLKKYNPQLKTLALINCKLKEKHLLFYLQDAALKQLQLMNCGAFGSSFLTTLAQSCPSLENLEIEMSGESHPHPFDDISIGHLAKNCPSLTMLTLKSDNSTKKADRPWQLSALSLQHLAHCLNLSHLNLSHLNLIPSDKRNVSAKEAIDLLTNRCLKISHLGLPNIQATKGQVLSLILPYKRQLSSLYLSNNQWVDLPFLKKLSDGSNLLYLWLNRTSIESDGQVVDLFPNLNYLDV